MNIGDEFENKVAETLRSIDIFSGPNARVFKKKVYPGAKDPRGYEIDIAIELHLTSDLFLLFIFECKAHNRPIERSVVQQVIQVRDDISAHKAIIVSTNGFNSGAVRLAENNRIALWQWVNWRFKSVLPHMASIDEYRTKIGIIVRGASYFFRERGIILDTDSIFTQLMSEKAGKTLKKVGFVMEHAGSSSKLYVSPSATQSGYADYHSFLPPTPKINLLLEVVKTILQREDYESRALTLQILSSRYPMFSRAKLGSFLDQLIEDERSEESIRKVLRTPFPSAGIHLEDREERERKIEEQFRHEDEALRQEVERERNLREMRWYSEGRCIACGRKLGIWDKLRRKARCRNHF